MSLLVSVFLCAGCSPDAEWESVLAEVRRSFPEVPQLGTAELAARLSDDSDLILLDARSADEYAVSHLPGARHLNSETENRLLQSLHKSTPLVLYCSVGWRSSQAARRLIEAGFQEVHNLEGSIFKWANEGRPVYQDGRRVDVVHPYDDSWGKLLRPELHCCLDP